MYGCMQTKHCETGSLSNIICTGSYISKWANCKTWNVEWNGMEQNGTIPEQYITNF